MAERGELDGRSLAAVILAVVAWMGFLAAFFFAEEPFLFLVIALGAGIAALVLSLRARRDETTAAAAGAAVAGATLLYGLTLAALLTAMVYAMGVLLLLILLVFLGVMATPRGGGGGCSGSSSSSSGGGCCDNCCDGCCDGCCSTACDCGCGSCCDCGGCDCGGCGCIAFGFVAAPAAMRTRKPFRAQLAHLLRHGLAHHPDTPDYAHDVYRVGSARWCIGCFTTFPVFLVASTILILVAAPAWNVALPLGVGLAAMQAISSAGLARRWWIKALVKSSLGIGLALYVAGVHSAPWPPAAKVAALAAALALAWLSTIPRTRRMRARALRV